ncbi:DNA primase small subunit domain-containing protein [Halorubrum halodurans]|uniref:DNA primase small subunit domain-containing protein n=1 Tax=Halorubrum halodurans TaxID=1383851 RepID=UPI00117A3F18|nr:DNA primase small subunit domain-containing protein [Halorubrum halodurans]
MSTRAEQAEEFVHDTVQAYYDVYTDLVIEQTRNALQRDWGYTPLDRDTDTARAPGPGDEPGDVFSIPDTSPGRCVHTDLHGTDVLTAISTRTPAQVLTAPVTTSNHSPVVLHVPYFNSRPVARAYEVLTSDLGFEDVTVTFNGATGYTVTVRDAATRRLTRGERESVASYVRGDLDADAVTGREHVSIPGSGPERVEERITVTTHGWGDRIRDRCGEVTDRVTASTPGTPARRAVIRDLTGLPGVSPRTAQRAVESIAGNPRVFKAGIVDMNDAVYDVVLGVADRVLDELGVPVRLASMTGPGMYCTAPGSVNAATGLRVCRVPRERLLDAEFDPYTDGAVHWERVPGVPGTVPVVPTDTAPPTLPVITAREDGTGSYGAGGDCVVPVTPGEIVTVPTGTAVYGAAQGYAEIVERQ